jgi:hypothetical protein
VVDFASSITFDQFKDRAERLNSIDTYKTLLARARSIGYDIRYVYHRRRIDTATSVDR